MPQALVNATVERGFEWRSHTALVAAVSDAERELNGSGRVLIRPSGTEPVLRVMVEASEAELLKRWRSVSLRRCAPRFADDSATRDSHERTLRCSSLLFFPATHFQASCMTAP